MPQVREFYSDVDLKANQLFNSRLHNITTAARVALGLGLTTQSKGYMVYDTDLSTPYFWDGVAWQSAGGGGSYVPLSRNLTINGTTYDLSADRTWTITSGVSSVTATSPLSSTGGATPDISIQQANGSQSGYLSSADWTTFNSKFTLPSLTSGSVLFSNGTTITQDNTNFFWDDTNNRLGIGTNTPARPLDVIGQIGATGNIYAPNFYTPNAGLENQSVGGGASYFKVYTNIDNRPVLLSSNNTDILGVNSYTANSYLGVGISDVGSPANVINSSSILLGLNSTTRGFLLPSLTTAQRNAISTPVTGLQVYNNTTNKISYYDGSSWVELGSGTGTVTSVGVTPGTGISASVANATTTPNITITNTAPDQTVVLSNGTGISTSGTYPNFTITNSAPDQTVVLNAGTGISVTGTYPNFTITNASTSGNSRSVNSVSTNTTAASAANTDYVYLVSGTTTITLPSPASNTNLYTIKRTGTGVVSIATTSGLIDGSTAPININVRYVSVDLISDGTDWFII